VIVPIPTNEADALRRLQRTHELLRSAKERHKALPANLLTDATAFIPPVNLVISNVPGPRNPLFLAGAQLQANYPVSVVVDGVGLNITVMSYRGHLDFGIVADRELVDDVWSMLDGLRSALAEFESAVGIERASDESGARAGSTAP
jgi:hypothetical protein